MSTTILLVDGDDSFARLIADVLTYAGYRVVIAADATAGLAAITRDPPALVLLDLMLPGISGQDLLIHLRRAGFPILPIVIIETSRVGNHGALAPAGSPYKNGFFVR